MLISVVFIVSKILLVECAPKIGHVLFDPLLYEAVKDNIGDIDTPADHTSSSDDDFLVNDPRIKASPEKRIVSQSKSKATTKANMSEINENFSSTTTVGNPRTEQNVSTIILRNNGAKSPDTVAQYGYEFDQTICKEVNKVIMCGYNKNQGNLNDRSVPVAFQNKEGCVIRHDRIECGYVKGGYYQGARLLRGQSLKYFSINSTDILDQFKLVWAPEKSSSIISPTFSSTFPADSAPVLSNTDGSFSYSESINYDSEPIHTAKIKVTTSINPELKYTIKLNVPNSEFGQRSTSGLSSKFLSALTSGKMTSWLTSRVAPILREETTKAKQVPTRTTTTKILTSALTKGSMTPSKFMKILTSTVVKEPVTSKLPEGVVTTTEDTTALRNKEAILEDSEGEPSSTRGGCSSCIWKTILKNKSLRNVDDITTRKCVTRCVEIGDRIVCYPVKSKTTTPMTP